MSCTQLDVSTTPRYNVLSSYSVHFMYVEKHMEELTCWTFVLVIECNNMPPKGLDDFPNLNLRNVHILIRCTLVEQQFLELGVFLDHPVEKRIPFIQALLDRY